MSGVVDELKAPRSRTMFDALEEQAERGAEQIAIIDRAGRQTYGQWYEQACQVRNALAALGVRRGSHVGLLASNHVEWLHVYLGAAALGAPLFAFNTWAKAWDLEYLLAHSAVELLIVQDRHASRDYLVDLRTLVPELWQAQPGQWRSERFPRLRTVVVLGDDSPPAAGALDFSSWLAGEAWGSPGIGPAPPDESPGWASATDPAVVLYTSGSTARPKAVPLLHYGLVENGFHIGERMGLSKRDRIWLGSPLFWSFGCANALMASLTHGSTLVLQEQFDADAAIELIQRHACTAAYLLPALTRAIAGADGFDPQRLGTLRTGLTIGTGDDVRLAAETLGVTGICNIYGSTETYGNCAVTPHSANLLERLTSQGPPLPGVDIRVVNPMTRRKLPVGEVGELEVSGYLTAGYLDTDVGGGGPFTEDGYYRTGDLGSMDDRGWLHFSARATEMIKTSGINVAPAEVEEFLLTHPAVSQTVVVGVPDVQRGEAVVAYVVLAKGQRVDELALREYCRSAIASYKTPVRVIVTENLPTTVTGKLHRARIKDLAAQAVANQLSQGE